MARNKKYFATYIRSSYEKQDIALIRVKGILSERMPAGGAGGRWDIYYLTNWNVVKYIIHPNIFYQKAKICFQ